MLVADPRMGPGIPGRAQSFQASFPDAGGGVAVAVEPGSVAANPRGHVVQFYGRDEELTERVAEYLADAITAGGVAVMVATPDHRQAIEARLAATGVAVHAARRDGRFAAIDADSLLSRFVADGRVDRAAFAASVGQVVREAAARARPVRVFGEMVAILWSSEQRDLAVELEAAWNELAQEVPFALYCGYPERSVHGSAQRGALRQVCQHHTAVIGPPPAGFPWPVRPAGRTGVTRAFEGIQDAPRAARHFVLGLLAEHGMSGRRTGPPSRSRAVRETLVTDVALVVTELATNAVRHARSAFTVSAAVDADAVHISVADTRPLPAGRGTPAMTVMPDHGLGVVDAIAARWGVQTVPGGKVVWARLRLRD